MKKKIVKRIAAMGAAVMMMSSMATICTILKELRHQITFVRNGCMV